MMQIHVSGRLVRDPAQKTSSNGRPYVTALLTAGSGDNELLVTLMVFDAELSNLLASLRKGDSVSAIGSGSVRGYLDKAGQPAAGVTLMANRLMAMAEGKAAPKPKPKGSEQRYRRTEEFMSAGPREFAPDEFNDRVPF